MNVLVAYFSQTGNTETIARALHEEISERCSCFLKKIDESDASSLDEYDLILVGSPCHAGTLAAPVRELLSLLPDNPSFHLAGFITHASSVYNKSDFENCMTYFHSVCSKKSILYHGCYECRGALDRQLHDFIKKRKNVSDAEWTRMASDMEGHPDKQDIANARIFAQKVIKEMQP